ncbi:hypothetical protein DFH29DRAFT_824279 [Suillus ampliporus]|nr:hypothetical protein DFH29DRAFT_824279 [Suillus ampliporus]
MGAAYAPNRGFVFLSLVSCASTPLLPGFTHIAHQRVFTDANVRDPGIAVKMRKATEKAYEEARNAEVVLHPSVELALELVCGDGTRIGYYFVDHDRRIIFWFEAHKSHHVMLGVRGVERKSHVRYALETQYWRHVELFPNKRSLPEDVVVRLKEFFIQAQSEYIVGGTSISLLSSAEVTSMLSLVDPLMSSTNKEHEHSVHIIARCMKRICMANFMNFYGQPGARLDTEQSLYRDSNTRSKTILFRVMNLIFFGSPDAYSKVLHGIWVNDLFISWGRHRNFIDRLNSEWNGYAIFSTVMLAVDISFLAVPFVQTQTSAILVSYLSTLCTMGSLVVTLVFARQVNDDRRYPDKRLSSFKSMMYSIERLALMLSLPFAFLIWGIIFFAAALSIVIFRTSDVITVSIAYPIWAAIVILATWPALTGHINTLKYWMKCWIIYLKWYFNFGLSRGTVTTSPCV